MKSNKTRIIVIILIFLAAAVVLYALFGPDAMVDTPAVILPTPITGASAAPDGSGTDAQAQLAEVTPETVQAVVGQLTRAESYSRTVTIENFWADGSGSEALDVWYSSGNIRIRSERQGKTTLCVSGGSVYIWYDDSADVYVGNFMDGSADEWLRCVTYETLLGIPPSAISAAGYEMHADEPCIRAEYVSGSLGYRDVVFVSVNTGLLMGAETYAGDELIYKMTSTAPDLSLPDDSLFVPPVS